MNITRRTATSALFFGSLGVLSGCQKQSQPAISQEQAQEQAAATYQKLIEESKARVAASKAASAPAPAEPEPTDPYQVERWLSNIGYQRNLAARIRQDINLFALLVPEMAYFARSGRYDKAYLTDGLKNTPLVDVASKVLLSRIATQQLVRANSVVITDPFRSFVIMFSSSFYESQNFLKFLSEPLDITQWRMDAIGKFNQLVSFDRTQAAVLRAVGPVLLARFPVKDPSSRAGLVEQLASNLALYRSAWGMREMKDQEVYDLLAAASRPEVIASCSATAAAIGASASSLAAGMDAALPTTLPAKTSGLAGLEGLQPAQN